jgi:hypothetical protein
VLLPYPLPFIPLASAPGAVIEARLAGAARAVLFACDSIAGDRTQGYRGGLNEEPYIRHQSYVLQMAPPMTVEWRCPEGKPPVMPLRLLINQWSPAFATPR